MARILGISGSQRAASQSRQVLRHLLREVEKAGGETHLLDLCEVRLPLLSPDDDGESPAWEEARRHVLWADAIALASPDYHGGMSGTVKNFLDHFWGEFTGRLFGYIVASNDKGLTVQDQMRTAVRQCYGWSLPYGIGFNPSTDLAPETREPKPALAERIEMMAHDLNVYGALLHGRFEEDIARDPRPPGFARRYRG